MPPQNNKHLIAPLEIVKHYEAFKKALDNGDFLVAESHLKKMRTFQGGEKLSKELEDEFLQLKEETFLEGSKEQEQKIREYLDESEDEEFVAQKILTHLESYESFVKDKSFDLAVQEVGSIKSLGDVPLAQTLESRLIAIKNKHQKQREKNQEAILPAHDESEVSLKIFRDIVYLSEKSLQKAQEFFEKNKSKLIEKDIQNAVKFFEEKKAEIKKDLLYDFHKSLNEGRTTFAGNLLKKSELPEREVIPLFNLLESKKVELKEEKRKEKVHKLSAQVQKYLENKDFQNAKKNLTKLKGIARDEEYQKAEELLQESLKDDKKKVEVNLEKAIKKNIEDEDFLMAEQNLKDYKRIVSPKKYVELEDVYFTKKEQSIRKKPFSSTKELEKNEQDLQLLNEANAYLLNDNWAEAENVLREMKKEKVDQDLQEYLKQKISQKKDKFEERVKYESRSTWKENFSKALESKNLKTWEALKKQAPKLFTEEECENWNIKWEEQFLFQSVDELIKKQEFSEAKKLILDTKFAKIPLHQKEKKLLEITEEEYKSEIEPLQEQTQKIQEEIAELKKQGNFDKAIQKTEKLVSLQKEIEYKEMKSSLEEEKKNRETEEIYGQVLASLEAGNLETFIQHKDKFSSVKKLFLLDKYLEKLKSIQEESRQKKFKELDAEFHKNVNGSIETLTQIFEAIQKIANEQEITLYSTVLENKKHDLAQVKILEAEKYLKNNQTEKVRKLSQEILDLGHTEEADILLSKSMTAERALQKESIYENLKEQLKTIDALLQNKKTEKVEAMLSDFENIGADEEVRIVREKLKNAQLIRLEKELKILRKQEKFLQAWEFLTDNQKVFASDFKKQKSFLIKDLEHAAAELIQNEKFVKAKTLLAILEKISPEDALPMKKILLEKDPESKKIKLPEEGEILQKENVLEYYQQWKSLRVQKMYDDNLLLKIEQTGEQDFSDFLKKYDSLSSSLTLQRKIFTAMHEENLQALEEEIQDVFLECYDLSLLESLLSKYFSLHAQEKEKNNKISEEKIEQKLQEYLQKGDALRAIHYFKTLPLKNIKKSRALFFTEKLVASEKVLGKEKDSENKILFKKLLEQKLWDKSLEVLKEIKDEDLTFSHLFLSAKQKSLRDSMNEKWEFYKEEIEKLLDEKNIKQAWAEVEKIDDFIPFELYETERNILTQTTVRALEEYMKDLQKNLEQNIQQNDFTEAEKSLKELSLLKKDFDERRKKFVSREKSFQDALQSLSLALEKSDKKKAENIIKASKTILTHGQISYLKYFLENHEKKSPSKSVLEKENKFHSALKENDFSKAEEVLMSLQFNDFEKYLDFLNAYKKAFSTHKKEQGEKEEQETVKFFNTLLEKSDFKNAEKTLHKIESLKEYTESFYAFEEAKDAFLKQSLQRKIEEIENFLNTKSEKDFYTKLQGVDTEVLSFILIYGDVSVFSQYKKIYEKLLGNPSFPEQKSILEFLEKGELQKAKEANSHIKNIRLYSYFQNLLEEKEKELSADFWREKTSKIKRMIQEKNFEEARRELKSLHVFVNLEDIENLYVSIVQGEIANRELLRKETVESLQEDLKKLIKKNKINEAEVVFLELEKHALEHEIIDLRIAFHAIKKHHTKKKVSQFEKFVWKALKNKELKEARKYVQEIELEGDQETANELKKELEVLETEERIQQLIAEKKFDEAERLLKNI